MSSADILGMALWFLKTTEGQYALCPLFGQVPSTICDWTDFGLEVLQKVVIEDHKNGGPLRITWPTLEELCVMEEHINTREYAEALKGIFAVMDGARIPCADYIDADIQNGYYEGFTCSVQVTNLLVFSFDGCLIHKGLNFPGAYHDSRVAKECGLIENALDDTLTPPGKAILCDTAFHIRTEFTNGKVVRAKKNNERSEILQSEALQFIEYVMQRTYPIERQPVEWGVRALKTPFGRLRLPLTHDSAKRGRMLRICAHMLNLRTRLINLNQIRTVYALQGTDSNPWVQRFLTEQRFIHDQKWF